MQGYIESQSTPVYILIVYQSAEIFKIKHNIKYKKLIYY